MRRLKTVRRPPIYPKTPGHLPYSLTHPLPLSSRRPSVSFGGFGLTLTSGLPKRLYVGPLWEEHGYVFTQETGRPVDPDIVSKAGRSGAGVCGG